MFPQASQEETETQASSMKPVTQLPSVSARYPTERAVSTRERFFCEACIEHHSRGRSASATDRSSFPAPTGQTALRTAASNAVFQPSSRCATASSVTPWKHCTPDGRGRQSRCRLVHAVRAARTALCPASPSFLECTPRSGRGSRGHGGYIGGTGGVEGW